MDRRLQSRLTQTKTQDLILKVTTEKKSGGMAQVVEQFDSLSSNRSAGRERREREGKEEGGGRREGWGKEKVSCVHMPGE
jgi:hypothetical protein